MNNMDMTFSVDSMATGRVWAGFSMPEPDLQPIPMTWTGPFNKQIFFLTLNPSRWVLSCHDWPKIKNTNYKHTNFRFMIFRPKIINTDTNPNMNSKITNKNFKFMIFPFKIRNTNTNFRFMIFHFKITNTNTNTNSHDWDELNPEKEKEKKNGERGGARPWEGSWARPWGGAVEWGCERVAD